MFLPKAEIFEALKAVDGLEGVQHGGQMVFRRTPAVVFRIDENRLNLDLENRIGHQEILATVDIFTQGVAEASSVLSKVEEAMRNIGYRLENSVDIPPLEGALHHINCRFSAVKFND